MPRQIGRIKRHARVQAIALAARDARQTGQNSRLLYSLLMFCLSLLLMVVYNIIRF